MESMIEPCRCTTSICRSEEPPRDGELAGIVVANRLKALYRFYAEERIWKSACVFSTAIFRG